MYGSAGTHVTEYIVEVRGQFSGVSSLHFLRVHWFKLKNSQCCTGRTLPTDSFSPTPNSLVFKQILTIYCCSFFLSWTESWHPWSCYSLYSRGWPHSLNTLYQAIKMEITWTFVTFKHNYTMEYRMIWVWTTTEVENINNSIKANYLNYVAKYKKYLLF